MNDIPNGLAEIRKYYGTPWNSQGKLDQKWYNENIITLTLPYPMRIAWAPATTIKKIPIHKKCAESLEKILKEIWNQARIMVKEQHGYDHDSAFYDKKTLELIKKLNLDQFGGTFNFRKIHGSTKFSGHSWGASIDLDPTNNAQGDQTPAMPMWVVKIFEDEGWVWGGRWTGKKKDGMHMQRFSGY